jgi:hypothetical protein
VVERIGLSGSLTDQLTTTKFPYALPRYQLFVPTVPVIVYVTIGGVVSLGTGCLAAALSGIAAAAKKQNAMMLSGKRIGRRRM